jgi:septum site-determining protein MinC
MDKPCFELKGSLFTLSVLQLFDHDLSHLEEQLQERIKMAPGFFNHTPFVIDLHLLPEDQQDIDFTALKELLLSLSMIPVGVKGADKSLRARLEAAGLATLAEAKHKIASEKSSEEPQLEQEHKQIPETESAINSEPENLPDTAIETALSPAHNTAKIIRQTVRSGQQVYAPKGDLVVIGSVSAGAELLADGNIHVYGTLRGRALAGVQGDQSASIFCHSLQAELSSIAGIYLLSDDLPEDKIGNSVQIYLENEKIRIESI